MTTILHIAIPCPLRLSFSYLPDKSNTHWQTGLRVKVPFRNKEVIGIIVAVTNNEKIPTSLKQVSECIDQSPIISAELLSLANWLSQYYHHPIGDVFQTLLPKKIRQGESANLQTEKYWQLIKQDSVRQEKQQAIIDLLKNESNNVSQAALYKKLGACRSSLITLEKNGLIKQQQQIKQSHHSINSSSIKKLNEEQKSCVNSVWQSNNKFNVHLLDGITGSGKTEVYIELTKQILNQDSDKQVLILIPEIGLITQFVTRFRQNLSVSIETISSSMSDSDRKQSWLLTHKGIARVLIGTRSAVFTPFKNLALIIIDEEHDASYKQQDGLKYHARNIALIRAKQANIPVLLGSATPSLESLYHVQQQRYMLLKLIKRATGASLPKVHVIDSTGPKADNGISSILYHAIETQLNLGNQILLFINRRGFAPVLMCHECNWQAVCTDCDSKMIVHQRRNTLCCHHCGLIKRLPHQCPKCQHNKLNTYGAGTEQIELSLQRYFPKIPVLRIDRDSMQKVNAFKDMIDDIRQGGPKILVGTQMLAKGHDFHDVTLVGVLDADQGLLSADFRASENLAQLIIQVTGRAGRGEKSGEVFIQTQQPQHPFWKDLIQKGYGATAEKLLIERSKIGFPPVGYLSLIRAEDKQEQLAMQFLTDVQALLSQHQQDVIVMGPVPALMEKKGGRYRAQLLLSCASRKPIHQLLDQYIEVISKMKLARKIRWSIDIDPLDLM